MGEYATRRKDGKLVTLCKLGTLDDWRYGRRQEAELLAETDAGAGTNISLALASSEILWRFPWPDEDKNSSPRAIGEREMFRTLPFPAIPIRGLKHGEFVAGISLSSGGYSYNLRLPCPATWKNGRFKTTGRVERLFAIVGERYHDGHARTIFQCAWCETPFSVNQREAEAIREVLRQQESGDGWYFKVAERIRPGEK